MGSNIKITDELEEYINNHSHKLNPIQREIIKYNKTLGEKKKLQISLCQCHLLHLIIKLYNPKKILEIGTFTGLSALTMGLAMNNDSNLIAIDKNKQTSEIAKKFFVKANLESKINLLVKNASDGLDELLKSKEVFDLVFIDADKENYINYFEKSLKMLKKSGIIITDNVLWYGDVIDKDKSDKLTIKIREFNSHIDKDKRVENIILPIGDGLSICRKL
ncbi:class I SAM-dependent methyltransferase [Candidatus Pelagibacter sp.]|nr:class I SAM-dependent methyltransferase [Candidatus Pelagibacter sp.]